MQLENIPTLKKELPISYHTLGCGFFFFFLSPLSILGSLYNAFFIIISMFSLSTSIYMLIFLLTYRDWEVTLTHSRITEINTVSYEVLFYTQLDTISSYFSLGLFASPFTGQIF